MTTLANRYNNPGNLKASDWTKSQPGYVGAGNGGLAIFDNALNGANAQQALLANSYLNKGYDTVSEIVNKYAPVGSENSQASVNNYIASVSKSLGVSPDQKLTQSQVPALAAAMAKFEGYDSGATSSNTSGLVGASTSSDTGSAGAATGSSGYTGPFSGLVDFVYSGSMNWGLLAFGGVLVLGALLISQRQNVMKVVTTAGKVAAAPETGGVSLAL